MKLTAVVSPASRSRNLRAARYLQPGQQFVSVTNYLAAEAHRQAPGVTTARRPHPVRQASGCSGACGDGAGVTEPCGTPMNAMFAAAGATRRAAGVDRLGVEPLLGELDEDQVDDDEPHERAEELQRKRCEAERVSQRRNRDQDADSDH